MRLGSRCVTHAVSLGATTILRRRDPTVNRRRPANPLPRRVGRDAGRLVVVRQLLLQCFYARAKRRQLADEGRLTPRRGLLRPAVGVDSRAGGSRRGPEGGGPASYRATLQR